MFKQYVIKFKLKGEDRERYAYVESKKPTTKEKLKTKLNVKLKTDFPELKGNENFLENVEELFFADPGDLFDWQGKFHKIKS